MFKSWFPDDVSINIEFNKLIFDIEGSISGELLINTLNGSEIWHNGIKISIDQIIVFSPLLSADLNRVEANICSEGWLKGKSEIQFSIPLSAEINDEVIKQKFPLGYNIITDSNSISYKNVRWFESYKGTYFNISHNVTATISRSWYSYLLSQSYYTKSVLQLYRINHRGNHIYISIFELLYIFIFIFFI
jgi:hypothetical protein